MIDAWEIPDAYRCLSQRLPCDYGREVLTAESSRPSREAASNRTF